MLGPFDPPLRPPRLQKISHDSQGLSLVELLVTMAILSVLIGILAPIAVRKRINANEVAAIGGLKAILSGCAAYYNINVPHRYPPSLKLLGQGDSPYIDSFLAGGVKSGYVFTMQADTATAEAATFTAEAHPTLYRRQGVRSFFIDDTGRLLGEDIGGFPGHGAMSPIID